VNENICDSEHERENMRERAFVRVRVCERDSHICPGTYVWGGYGQ